MEKGLQLYSAFVESYNQLKESGLIFPVTITDYAKASQASLHSLLNYALIMAGIQSNYFALPEYKLRLKVPLTTPKGRHQHFIQVDTAYFKGDRLEGVGEVFTLDEIHGCVPSGHYAEKWQTPYEKLNHIVRHYPRLFLIIVNVIPSWAKMPTWPGIKDRSLEQWKQGWEQLISGLKAEGSVVHHIIIDENQALPQTY
jgi:hypothetical protein